MPWKKLTSDKFFVSVGIGAVLVFIFVCFSYLVNKDLFTQFDFNTTIRLQDNISRRFDNEFSFFSEIGKFEVSTIVLIVLIAFQFIAKPRSGAWIRKTLFGIIAFSSYVGFHLIELFGKFYLNHPPPPQFMLRTEHLFDFPQFHIRSEFSYPSGHSGRAAFLSVIIIILVYKSDRLSKPLKLLIISGIILYDIAMWVSRIYLGEHWTTDVIGGALLGGALGLISGGVLLANFPAERDPASQDKLPISPFGKLPPVRRAGRTSNSKSQIRSK